MGANEILAYDTRPGALTDAGVHRDALPAGALEPVAADRSDRDVRFGAYPTPKE